jgi:hypothetical protein
MLCVVRTKACKRCGGDLSLECDIYGVYVQCIQCGASYNKEDLPPAEVLAAPDALRAVKAPPRAAMALHPSKHAGKRP